MLAGALSLSEAHDCGGWAGGGARRLLAVVGILYFTQANILFKAQCAETLPSGSGCSVTRVQ